ncbi:DUF413 domain-containing protein [Paracoccaceae bacterium]|nr:DUF413 domain-containing protein [Paracoccaceae bacterium]
MFLLDSKDTLLLKDCIRQLKELAEGLRSPKTLKQQQFLKVIKGYAEPQTKYEKAYLRFMALSYEHQKDFIEKFGKKYNKKSISKGIKKRKSPMKKKMTAREKHIHEAHKKSGFYTIRAHFVRG